MILILKRKMEKNMFGHISHTYLEHHFMFINTLRYSASLKIYQDIKDGKKDAMEKYLNMLKSGGSDYPVNQAKAAGADLTDKTTFNSVVRRFNELIDQLEKLL